MEQTLIYTCLLVLAIFVALNLKLTLHLFELIRNPSLVNPPFLPRQIGEPMPSFTGRALSGLSIELEEAEGATAMLFLSSRCPQCQEKLPELEALIPLLQDAGLTLWLVTSESKRHFTQFLNNSPLLEHVVLVNSKTYKQINPTMSTPYYLFVNHVAELEAGGVIGDEDWQSFSQQMDEIRQGAAAA